MSEQGSWTGGISRKRFLRDTGVAAVAVASAADRALAVRPGRLRRARRPTVAVFGGGIAGLTAAHELAQRGFAVTVYERRAWGGRAAAAPVPHTAGPGRKPLPGEHSFHVYFGAYRNFADTMRRIPFGSNARGTLDNLVAMPQAAFARVGKPDLVVPLDADPCALTPAQLVGDITGLLLKADLPPAAAAHFADRVSVHLSSCDARRHEQWDSTTWPDFIGADRYPGDYQKLLGQLPQVLFASKPERSSADFLAWVLEILIIYNVLGFGRDGRPALQVPNQPSNDAWLTPWLAELHRLGVQLRLRHEVTGLTMRRGRIHSAGVRTPHGHELITADWFVSALPVQRARRLWNKAILAADPTLASMAKIDTAWSNGAQFYLRAAKPLLAGLLACVDSPWDILCLQEAQFWNRGFAASYGDGQASDCLSAAIANWNAPGIVYGKPATRCTRTEFAHEIWEQIKAHVNKPGEAPRLTDGMRLGTHLDDDVSSHRGRLVSDVSLVLPTAGTRRYRPDITTAIPNLTLCGDYLAGAWEIANMEAANYNGRRAANAILAESSSRETPATTTVPYQPPEWEPLRKLDEQRYRQGEPNILDAATTIDELDRFLNHAVTSIATRLI